MSAERVYHISEGQFIKIQSDFVKSMDDIESFLDEALANGLLLKAHESKIMSSGNSDDQIRQLHDYILKKLPECSDKFVSALKKSGHDQILDLFDDPSVYPMKFKPHGRVILINNIKFEGETYDVRLGSEKDVEGITELFEKFNFDVKPYPNKTAAEMESIIEKEAKANTDNEDCFVMFLMSHGVLGNIVGTEGDKLPYSTINNILKNSSQLQTKPKLIYINTCQVNSDKKDAREYFDVPDLYVEFSTVPECLAFRTEAVGSIFIKSLISVYEKNKEKCDISALSSEITSQVSIESKRVCDKDQISSSYTTLKKKVILRVTD